MELGLLMTARCNASCAHCATDCGPQRSEALARDKLLGLIDEAAALSDDGKPLQLYLSGGEPFLDVELLLEVVAHAHRLGAFVSCVTNASWATSRERAHHLLSAVRDAGLSALAVSSSRFHERFVPRERVRTALEIARALGLRCVLKHVRTGTDADDPETVRAWAMAAGAADVEEIGLMPHLRAGEPALPDREYVRRDGLPQGRCPARVLTIREDGEAYTCCTPGAFTGLLSLGSAHRQPLRELRERFYLGGMQQILRQDGPLFFARQAQAAGEGQRLRASYASVCELCTHIAGDPALAALAAEAARDFEVRQIENILRKLVS